MTDTPNIEYAGDFPVAPSPVETGDYGTTLELVAPERLAENHRPLDPTHLSLEEVGKIGRAAAQSGWYSRAVGVDQKTQETAQALVKILHGQELGIGPMQAMSQIHVVDGKPSLSAGLVGAMVKKSNRYDYQPITSTAEECEIRWYQLGEIVGTSSFTLREAQAAGLVRGGSGWAKYPADMLFARALTRGARRFCPDVFGGAVYTPEELGSTVAGTPPSSGAVEPTTPSPRPISPPPAPAAPPPAAGAPVEETPPTPPSRSVSEAVVGTGTPRVLYLTEKQRAKLFAFAKEANVGIDDLRQIVRLKTGQESTTKVPRHMLDDLLGDVAALGFRLDEGEGIDEFWASMNPHQEQLS